MSSGAVIEHPEPPLSDGVVTLRPFDHDDIDQVWLACQDGELQRFIPVPRPYLRPDAEEYVTRTIQDWADGTKAAFAIVDAAEVGRLLGAINVAISGVAGNTGYWITADARGGGIATRALRLITDWSLGVVGLGVVILEIRPENERSQRVARAAGFHLAGRIDVNDVTGEKNGLIFSRLASDIVG